MSLPAAPRFPSASAIARNGVLDGQAQRRDRAWDMKPSQILTRAGVRECNRVCSAIGGSTERSYSAERDRACTSASSSVTTTRSGRPTTLPLLVNMQPAASISARILPGRRVPAVVAD